MMKKTKMNRFLFPILLFWGTTLFGQPDELVLTGIGTRKVEKAYRMTESPKIIDTNITSKVTEYPLLVLQHYTQVNLQTIDPVTIKTDSKPTVLTPFYIKAGIGSRIMPLGEFYYNSKRSKKYVYGLHSKHISSFATIKDYANSQFDRTSLGAYGTLNEKKYTLDAALNYQNHGFHYYGLTVPQDTVSATRISQRFQESGAQLMYASHIKDSSKLNYHFAATYRNFQSKKPFNSLNDNWRVRENSITLNAGGFYVRETEKYALDVNFINNNFRYGTPGDTISSKTDTGIVQQNTIFNLVPTITSNLLDKRIKMAVGVDVTIASVSKTRAYIYPLAEVSYELYDAIFVPYLGVRGGLKQTTFRSLSTDNQFIQTNPQMLNENKPFDIYGGFKGTLSKHVSFNLGGSYSHIFNKALFVSDTNYIMGHRFKVIYDTMSIAMAEGSLSYQLDEKIKIDGIGRYFHYALENNAFAWNMPEWQLIMRGNYLYKDDLHFSLDINIEGGRKALVYKNELNVIHTKTQLAQKMGLLADLNIQVEYRYTKTISAFIQLNNALAQRYIRWYNYPVQGFQIMGGISARF